jgi:hypothetical protein
MTKLMRLLALIAVSTVMAAAHGQGSLTAERVILVSGATGTQGGAVARHAWFIEHHERADLEALRREFSWLQTVEHYLREAGWSALANRELQRGQRAHGERR